MSNSSSTLPKSVNNAGQSILVFAGVGFVSTALDLLVLKLSLLAGINVYIATALGFLAGLTNGYFMNSRFVFQKDNSPVRYFKYGFISIIGLGITELIIYLLHGSSGRLSELEAKLVAVVVVFFWNYGLSKAWAFK